MPDQSGSDALSGYLNVCKPPDVTSHDVVARLRRLFGIRRIGHAGTLDPPAIGVLPVAIGQATRTLQSRAWDRKVYWADVCFGSATDTDDATGKPIARGSPASIDPAQIAEALRQFVGDIMQQPPAYSAIHLGGRRAYHEARRASDSGADKLPTLAPRPVHVDAASVVGWHAPVLSVLIQCRSGTYVRSIARDLGRALDCPAHLCALVRTRVGPFSIRDALDFDELDGVARNGAWPRVLWSTDTAASWTDAVVVDDSRAVDVAMGRPWPSGNGHGTVGWVDSRGPARVYSARGAFLGFARRAEQGRWQPTAGSWLAAAVPTRVAG